MTFSNLRRLVLAITYAWLLAPKAVAMTPFEAAQFCKPTGSPGYSRDVGIEGLWNLKAPITVFVPARCPCMHQQTFLWGLELWRQSTGGLFSYIVSDNPETAKVKVDWVTHLLPDPSIGIVNCAGITR